MKTESIITERWSDQINEFTIGTEISRVTNAENNTESLQARITVYSGKVYIGALSRDGANDNLHLPSVLSRDEKMQIEALIYDALDSYIAQFYELHPDEITAPQITELSTNQTIQP